MESHKDFCKSFRSTGEGFHIVSDNETIKAIDIIPHATRHTYFYYKMYSFNLL